MRFSINIPYVSKSVDLGACCSLLGAQWILFFFSIKTNNDKLKKKEKKRHLNDFDVQHHYFPVHELSWISMNLHMSNGWCYKQALCEVFALCLWLHLPQKRSCAFPFHFRAKGNVCLSSKACQKNQQLFLHCKHLKCFFKIYFIIITFISIYLMCFVLILVLLTWLMPLCTLWLTSLQCTFQPSSEAKQCGSLKIYDQYES